MTHALLFAYLFYVGFALAISIYRLWLKGCLNLFNKLLFAPVLVAFFALDVLLNYTLFLLLFGLPGKGDYTISQRLETYRVRASGFKRTVADFVCQKLLNPIDPTGTHC